MGLADVQAAYELVAGELRRFRAGLAPTTAESERVAPSAAEDALKAILAEVRAIREALEQPGPPR